MGESTANIPNTPMRWALQTETLSEGIQPGAAPATTIVEVDYVAVWAYEPSGFGEGPFGFGPATGAP